MGTAPPSRSTCSARRSAVPVCARVISGSWVFLESWSLKSPYGKLKIENIKFQICNFQFPMRSVSNSNILFYHPGLAGLRDLNGLLDHLVNIERHQVPAAKAIDLVEENRASVREQGRGDLHEQ